MASPPPKEKVAIQVSMTRGQRLLTTEKNLLKVHSVVFYKEILIKRKTFIN